jgi:hypothetical protein
MRCAANEQNTEYLYYYEMTASNLPLLCQDMHHDYVAVSVSSRGYYQVMLTQDQVNHLVTQDQDRAITERYRARGMEGS